MRIADRNGGTFFQALHSWLGLLCILVVSFFYFLTGITQVVDIYDEGIPVYGAERVLNGEIPYRGFWTIYAPGQFYALAGWFKIFGSSILAERVYDAIFRTLISLSFFLLASRLASRGWSLAFWLVVTIWLKFFGYYASANFPALFFALASFYVLFGFFDRDKPKLRLFIAGLLTGLAGLFRHDLGFYLFLSVLLTVYPYAFFHFIPKNGTEGCSNGLPSFRLSLGPIFWELPCRFCRSAYILQASYRPRTLFTTLLFFP